MHRMLEERNAGDLAELAADAVLPLILFCPASFHRLGMSPICSLEDI